MLFIVLFWGRHFEEGRSRRFRKRVVEVVAEVVRFGRSGFGLFGNLFIRRLRLIGISICLS